MVRVWGLLSNQIFSDIEQSGTALLVRGTCHVEPLGGLTFPEHPHPGHTPTRPAVTRQLVGNILAKNMEDSPVTRAGGP